MVNEMQMRARGKAWAAGYFAGVGLANGLSRRFDGIETNGE
jgi:hypothetical protein